MRKENEKERERERGREGERGRERENAGAKMSDMYLQRGWQLFLFSGKKFNTHGVDSDK